MKWLVQFWMRFLSPSFFGIGEGPSSSEYSEFGNIANLGNFSTSTGESDISTASDFFKGILSGDPTQLSRLLGPEYSNINQRGGQQLKTLSEFGTRSGGTAAEQQQVGDEMRRNASSLEGNAVMGAASSLSSMGSGLLSTGLSANEAAFSAANTIQQQKQQKLNDIFKSIADVVAAPFTGGASLTALTSSSSPTSNLSFHLPKFGNKDNAADDMSWMDSITGRDLSE